MTWCGNAQTNLKSMCLLLAHRPLGVMAIMSEAPRIKGIVWDYNIADDSVLRVVSAAGWTNYVYGAVTSVEHRRCTALGLAGLITDFPRLAVGDQA
jgi:glycerophosphoryl diester phosphodiesterase